MKYIGKTATGGDKFAKLSKAGSEVEMGITLGTNPATGHPYIVGSDGYVYYVAGTNWRNRSNTGQTEQEFKEAAANGKWRFKPKSLQTPG